MNRVNTILRLERKLSKQTHTLLTLAGIASIFIVWAAASYSGKINPIFLPSPVAVAAILVSIYRVSLGFALSVAVAIPLGTWIGIHKQTEALLNPLSSFLRYTPPSAFLPLFILWFGIGEMEKILVIFLAVTPYLLVLVADIIANTRKEFLYAALTLGAQSRDLLMRVILPQSLPNIWDSMRITIGFGWAFVILAEVVAATSGLGHLIVTSQRFLKTPNVMAAIIVIGLLGLATDLLFKLLIISKAVVS